MPQLWMMLNVNEWSVDRRTTIQSAGELWSKHKEDSDYSYSLYINISFEITHFPEMFLTGNFFYNIG